MQLFCPVCRDAFAGTQRCPRCGGLLLLPQEAAAEAAATRPKESPPPRASTPAGRIVVGAVLALGCYLGLRKLAMGAVFATKIEPDAWWSSFEGLSIICAAQVVAVLFGATIAAAGRTGGFFFGLAVGTVCGGLFLGAELFAGAPPQDLVLYVQPLVLACVGVIAGVIASRVWGVVPALNIPVERSPLKSSNLPIPTTNVSQRPTVWLRIVVGAMVMVLSVAAADQVRRGAQKYSGGLLRVETQGQGQFLSWQLAVLGVMGGAALAAAGTGAGIRHGMIAGLLAGVGVLGMTAAVGQPLAPVDFWLNRLSLGGVQPNDPIAIIAATSGMLFLGILGGWLGGTLFLPLAPEHLRKRLGEVD